MGAMNRVSRLSATRRLLNHACAQQGTAAGVPAFPPGAAGVSLPTLVPSNTTLPTSGSCRSFAAAADDPAVEVNVNPFQGHRLDSLPPTTFTVTRSELMTAFERMYTMRRMEIAADMLYKQRLIRGFLHLADGQEAVYSGMEAAIKPSDSVITSYRDHCNYVARGGSVKGVIAELMGKVDGAVKGKGGSMHMYHKEGNFYGGLGIVGDQVPLGAGLALAHKYRQDGGVAFAMYGDGAANQGQVFESFNMAALLALPVVFVVENNHYGMGTAEWRAAKVSKYYTRGDYIPGIKIDGMDFCAVKQGTAFARAWAQSSGPIVMELDTYRYHGHSMSDPGSTYRTRDEIAQWRQARDPVEHVRNILLKFELAEAADLKAIERRVKKEVDSAIEEAKASPEPPPQLLTNDVYVDPLGMSARGVEAGSRVKLTGTSV